MTTQIKRNNDDLGGPKQIMNFCESAFSKLFSDSKIMELMHIEKDYCTGTLGANFWIIARFISTYGSVLYDALEVVVLSRLNLATDRCTLRFEDILEQKAVFLNCESGGWEIVHNALACPNKAKHHPYAPTEKDWEQLRLAVKKFLQPYRDQVPGLAYRQTKLIYICAPLRGNVSVNIEFARQKAREIFQAGDVPICPHQMFPPIADPGNVSEDQAAREMGLHLVTICQQVNVYGNVTAGMKAEIDLARRLNIPVQIKE